MPVPLMGESVCHKKRKRRACSFFYLLFSFEADLARVAESLLLATTCRELPQADAPFGQYAKREAEADGAEMVKPGQERRRRPPSRNDEGAPRGNYPSEMVARSCTQFATPNLKGHRILASHPPKLRLQICVVTHVW